MGWILEYFLIMKSNNRFRKCSCTYWKSALPPRLTSLWLFRSAELSTETKLCAKFKKSETVEIYKHYDCWVGKRKSTFVRQLLLKPTTYKYVLGACNVRREDRNAEKYPPWALCFAVRRRSKPLPFEQISQRSRWTCYNPFPLQSSRIELSYEIWQ